ncbi:MAG: DDE-type integrase/transposase/recombinase [archaeon]
MKFTQKTLLETVRCKNNGWTTYQARKIAHVGVRRVNQLMTVYQETGSLPVLGKNMGRPHKPLKEREIIIVNEAYEKYRVSADTLERIIMRDYQLHIPHNRIHKILLILGFAKPKGKKCIRKLDWIRYERRHSLTAVHIDWHHRPNDGLWVFAVIDDASRKILALIECDSPTTEASIHGMELALQYGKIKQCISDHGSQFTTNLDGDSQFKNWLEKHDIQQILCRVKHPQSNGKVEKWFDTYERHRDAFDSINKFLEWYNEVRPHRSLNFDELETPQQAFIRKMRAEAI